MTDFELWESAVREELEFAHDKVTDLAFKTLEMCLQDIDMIDDFDPSGKPYQCDYDREYNIAENEFAKIDYIAYIYFVFRSILCICEPRRFVEEHDSFFQKLLIYYATTKLNISHEDATALLQNRFEVYDGIVAENPDEALKNSQDRFIEYIECDFLDSPFDDAYPIIGFDEDFWLKIKVSAHISALMNKLTSFRNQMKDSSATNTEQKERKLQSRTVRSISDLTMEDAANATEKALLLKYQTTLSQLEQQKEKLKNAKALYQNMIGDTDPLSSGVRKNLQDMLNMSNQVTVLENELKDIQNSPLIKKMIDRINNPHGQPIKNIPAQPTEVKKEQPSPHSNEMKPVAKNKAVKGMLSKRVAAIISLLLCAVLYLSFLFAFSSKRDTYICYTTKTGECFHAATCRYASKTAYETTVYEACRKYKPCNYCNPCVKLYETTITVRDYVTPIIISVPVSAAVYVLLTVGKKKTELPE